MATSIGDTEWLSWVERLMCGASRQRHTATLPMQKFHCVLDELPLHLIPSGVLDKQKRQNVSSGPYFQNPECTIVRAGEIPMELQARRDLLEGFYLQSNIAWVREPVLGTLRPFWLGPRFEALVSQLSAENLESSALPDDARLLLAGAGVLTSADHAQQRSAEWSKAVNNCAQLFREKNYAPLGNLIHPFHLAALRRYYRNAIRQGRIRLGDEQSSRRYVAHNEPVARYFHHQIAHVVGAVVGEPVKPSYVYLASYLSGAELKKHTDREQCEFSVTLCLDFSPEPREATSWPICLDTPQGIVTIYQALGDGLVYRGTKVPHYRTPLRDGYSSTSIFFHYVSEHFSGPLD
jgi:hypothetical protein